MSWDVKDFIFIFISIFTIGHAIIVVTNRNLVRSAFALLFSMLGIAGLYVMAGADFVAVVQVMIYVGGISILFLFAIMLTSHVTRVEEAGKLIRWPIGIIVVFFTGIIIGFLIWSSSWQQIKQAYKPTMSSIGDALLSNYLLPFEIISVLLLMAMIGAVVLARTERVLAASNAQANSVENETSNGGNAE